MEPASQPTFLGFASSIIRRRVRVGAREREKSIFVRITYVQSSKSYNFIHDDDDDDEEDEIFFYNGTRKAKQERRGAALSWDERCMHKNAVMLLLSLFSDSLRDEIVFMEEM